MFINYTYLELRLGFHQKSFQLLVSVSELVELVAHVIKLVLQLLALGDLRSQVLCKLRVLQLKEMILLMERSVHLVQLLVLVCQLPIQLLDSIIQ